MLLFSKNGCSPILSLLGMQRKKKCSFNFDMVGLFLYAVLNNLFLYAVLNSRWNSRGKDVCVMCSCAAWVDFLFSSFHKIKIYTSLLLYSQVQ